MQNLKHFGPWFEKISVTSIGTHNKSLLSAGAGHINTNIIVVIFTFWCVVFFSCHSFKKLEKLFFPALSNILWIYRYHFDSRFRFSAASFSRQKFKISVLFWCIHHFLRPRDRRPRSREVNKLTTSVSFCSISVIL